MNPGACLNVFFGIAYAITVFNNGVTLFNVAKSHLVSGGNIVKRCYAFRHTALCQIGKCNDTVVFPVYLDK